MNNINIRATLDKLVALGLSTAFHTSRKPLFLQKSRIVEACFEYGVEPVRN